MALLSFKKSKSFADFIESIKSGAENILDEVGLDENTFEILPYSTIIDNPSDHQSGVISVKLKRRVSVFSIFDTVLVKGFDTGEVSYVFYTTTRDHGSIINISETLFRKLDLGVYDSDRDFTFMDSAKVVALAKGQNHERSIVNEWLTPRYSLVLQYSHNPLHQFSLIIKSILKKQVDTSTRRGTIIDILDIDINKTLLQDEISMETSLLDDGSINCIDYAIRLQEKALGCFDTITIRLFSKDRVFSTKTQTHLTFTNSTEIPLKEKISVCSKIMAIYGSDWNGHRDLDIGELDILDNNEFWTGRRWHLDELNALNISGSGKNDIYWVEITNSMNEKGLTLDIGCYNKLLEYFT